MINTCLSTEKPGWLPQKWQSSKAELLQPQFKSAFTEEDLQSNLSDNGESPYPNMDNVDVSENGFFKLLQKLRPSKVTGPDLVPACILKELGSVQTPVFQRSLDTGHCPSSRKEVNNIQRTTDQSLSRLQSPSITFWSPPYPKLCSTWIQKDAHMRDSTPSYCVQQLLGGGGGVDVILLDFYKAFHMVPHQRLLHKLQYNEVGNNTLSWIQSFLSGRIQQVALKGTL